MCGIFGVIQADNPSNSIDKFISLGKMSETRGKEATGYFLNYDNDINFFKSPNRFSSRKNIKQVKSEKNKKQINFLVGHTRLKTEGDESNHENNQPCTTNNFFLVHNGIITNHKEIKHKYKFNNVELDSIVILDLMESKSNDKNYLEKFISCIKELSGEITICLYSTAEKKFIFYTNTGSLFFLVDDNNVIKEFASEKWILKKSKNKNCKIYQLDSFNGFVTNKDGRIVENFTIKNQGKEENYINIESIKKDTYKKKIKIPNLKRCSKCILPDTVPFITFDKDNVCNFCNNHVKIPLKDKTELKNILTDEENLIVGFSGGRDSSYGMLIAKSFFKGNIISVSYDWGMITELARRNQSRVTGKLGVEHVWASADIPKKRENIRKNLYAWLEKPDLGMIPILMAGDKVWQKILDNLADKNNSNYVLQFQSPYEVAQFKYGFSGVKPQFKYENKKFLNTSLSFKFKLFIYYFFGILKNYRYWNSSLWDSLVGYIAFNFNKTKLLYPFEYIEFNEEEIDKTLEENFQWEFDIYNPSSWRIGDGTAPFYNFIYWEYCGFTENDFFRSNQIRDGKLNRSEALKKTLFENQSKEVRIREYLKYINADYDLVIKKLTGAINKNTKVKDWIFSTYEEYESRK